MQQNPTKHHVVSNQTFNTAQLFHTQKTACEDTDTWGPGGGGGGGWGWNEASANQEMPGIAGKHQKLQEARKGPPPQVQREHSPADTLVLDFYPSELWDNKCLLF